MSEATITPNGPTAGTPAVAVPNAAGVPSAPAAALRSPGKGYRHPKAAFVVTHTALSQWGYGDEIAREDLPKGADVDNLVRLGALTPKAPAAK